MTTATATTRLVRRNYGRGHGYKLDGEKVVGVTTAIGVLDKPALRDWYARQAAERAIDEWDELAQMPVSQRLERIRFGARDKTTAAALRGTQIHELGQQLAEGKEPEVPDEHLGPVQAYARWLDKWDVTPWAAETPLASTQHKYAGTADLWGTVGKLGGEPFLLDIKTGKGIYDETAWQLAAYRYADLLVADGEEVSVPEVSGVYVAHVLPDDVRMLPIEAGPREFRTFLYILQTFKEVSSVKEWPLIGSAVQP